MSPESNVTLWTRLHDRLLAFVLASYRQSRHAPSVPGGGGKRYKPSHYRQHTRGGRREHL